MLKYITLLTLGGWLALAGAAQAQAVTFAPVVSYSTGGTNSQPQDLAVADVNGDGKRDIVAANSATNTLGVLLGNGNGTFQAATAYPAGNSTVGTANRPSSIILADVNGDGKLDALTANSNSYTAGVMLGNGTGSFQATATYPVGAAGAYTLTDIAVADVNSDNKLDLLVLLGTGASVALLLGNGNGTFQTVSAFFPTGSVSVPQALVVADVNSDGKLDLLTANQGTNSAGVQLGNGNGTFQVSAQYSTGTYSGIESLAVADVNNDGKLDLLAVNASVNEAGVLLGNGNGSFQPAVGYPLGGQASFANFPEDIAVADMNGDGKPDFITANYTGKTASVLLGNGNGTFQVSTIYSAGVTNQPFRLVIADVSGDGKPDVLMANADRNNPSNTVGVLLSTTILATHATLPGTSATLHPNPTTDRTALTVAGLPATVAQVQATLLDATGRAVGRQQLAAAQGSARADITMAGLAAGFYVLRLTAHDAQGQPIGSLPAQRLSVR